MAADSSRTGHGMGAIEQGLVCPRATLRAQTAAVHAEADALQRPAFAPPCRVHADPMTGVCVGCKPHSV